jgi:DNA-binding PadR family transcriptional regulator
LQTRHVFRTLLERPRVWRHGYDLAKQTNLQSGSLYPILIRLAEQGLLEERWEPSEIPGRPPRHAYRLTSSGVAAAREATEPADRRSPGRLRLARARR